MTDSSQESYYDKIAEKFNTAANENGKICNENTNHLSSVLFTATAAIIAITSAVLTNSDPNQLSCWQRIISFSALLFFTLSICAGIFSYIVSIARAQDVQANQSYLSEHISENQFISEEDLEIDKKTRKQCDRNSGSILLYVQIALFLIGITLTMVYAYSMLF